MGGLEVRLFVRGVLHTLLSRRVSLEWNEDCISQSIRCIWDLRDGVVLKKIGYHNVAVWAVVGDGKSIASGDQKGGLTQCTETQENLSPKPSKNIPMQSVRRTFLQISAVLATGSYDKTTKL